MALSKKEIKKLKHDLDETPVTGLIKTTLRVPGTLWQQVLIFAVVEHTSAQAIVTTALQDFFKDRKNYKGGK